MHPIPNAVLNILMVMGLWEREDAWIYHYLKELKIVEKAALQNNTLGEL